MSHYGFSTEETRRISLAAQQAMCSFDALAQIVASERAKKQEQFFREFEKTFYPKTLKRRWINFTVWIETRYDLFIKWINAKRGIYE
jgi:hypothetical protein